MKFSPQQEHSLQLVNDWLRCGDGQVFRLFGYAGTGKTTLAKHVAEHVENGVLYAAFTGKAAYVLKSKGCHDASTIHSLIYLPKEKSAARLKELVEKLSQMSELDPEVSMLKDKIREEKVNLARPSFSLNIDSRLREAGLLIVDEVSMVDERMAKDLLSFKTKILVLGDPAQLPPVYGTGYFISQEPNMMLTDIHRQARDNPIIHLADMIRNHRMPPPGQYGGSLVTNKIDADMVRSADQFLVGRNKTRKSSNRRYRELMGIEGTTPQPGDRLVCLRNENEVGLINGATWHVLEIGDVDEDSISMTVESDDNQVLGVDAHIHHFQDREIPMWERKEKSEFDYGYCLTVHKSQGSQWDHVCILDESDVFRRDKWRWLYTGVTRAAEKIELVNRSV